jgi:Zn-dependent protease with chaperone function
MSASPSLASRAVLAVVLLIGFYALAVAIAAVLVWIPVAEYQVLHRVDGRLAIACIAGALVILSSLVPRPDRFVAPGPRLEPGDHPRLFQELASVAHATDQAMPIEVYLVPDVNAWVSERGGTMGFGARRVMGLGLPLLQTLSVSEMRAVLAHEFGHYHGGDTRLGPWLFKTRAAIGRTLQGLRNSDLLQKPFEWYGTMFLRITHGVSRAQEFAADALAARVAGASALQSGLRRIRGAAEAYGPYWHREVVPVLSAGFRPPVADGFARFVARPAVAHAMAASVEEAIREADTDPFDTHPPLAERIAAVAGIVAVSGSRDDRPALCLLSDVAAIEREMVAGLTSDPVAAHRLQPVRWEEVGPRVVLPAWEQAVGQFAEPLSAMTVGDLPRNVAQVDDCAKVLVERNAPLSAEQRRAPAMWVLGAALGLIVVRPGSAIRSLPGEPVIVATPDGDFDPMAVVRALAAGEMTDAEWHEHCERLGIAGRALAVRPG